MEYTINVEENMLPRLLTIKQAKQYLGIGMNKIYELCKTPNFPSVRIDNKWYVDLQALDEWVDKHYFVNEKCEYYKLRDMWMCQQCDSVCKYAGKVFEEYE